MIARDIDVSNGATLIKVPDTLRALQALSVAVRRTSDATFVAVTGSAGKTTTKDMIAHALGSKHNTLKSQASYNNHIGVPLTLLATEASHSHVVTELGTNHVGEIDALARMVVPILVSSPISVWLMSAISAAKRRSRAKKRACSIMFRKEERASLMETTRSSALTGSLSAAGKRVVTVGFGRVNYLQAADVHYSETGTSGLIIHQGEAWPFSFTATGKLLFTPYFSPWQSVSRLE